MIIWAVFALGLMAGQKQHRTGLFFSYAGQIQIGGCIMTRPRLQDEVLHGVASRLMLCRHLGFFEGAAVRWKAANGA
ncbi:hypothetical protein D3C75_1201960 [compost metagenome]